MSSEDLQHHLARLQALYREQPAGDHVTELLAFVDSHLGGGDLGLHFLQMIQRSTPVPNAVIDRIVADLTRALLEEGEAQA